MNSLIGADLIYNLSVLKLANLKEKYFYIYKDKKELMFSAIENPKVFYKNIKTAL